MRTGRAFTPASDNRVCPSRRETDAVRRICTHPGGFRLARDVSPNFHACDYVPIHATGALFAGRAFLLLYRPVKGPTEGVLMAQRTVIRLVDDLDDTEIVDGGGETVNFALDGRRYEIDLTNRHADDLRAAMRAAHAP